MEFFLTDPNVLRLSPSETRLLDLRAEPSSDGKRLRVFLKLTPFLERPDLTISLSDPDGKIVASTSIVEPMTWGLDFTLHIRTAGEITRGLYKMVATLSYSELGELDRRELIIEIPSPLV
jgi:hypothetical protein